MTQEDKDLCKTCKHYWVNFPLHGDVECHCEIADERFFPNTMEILVPDPCLECPFNCYKKK